MWWKRPSGTYIETNDNAVKHCKSMGWVEVDGPPSERPVEAEKANEEAIPKVKGFGKKGK